VEQISINYDYCYCCGMKNKLKMNYLLGDISTEVYAELEEGEGIEFNCMFFHFVIGVCRFICYILTTVKFKFQTLLW
jgi:hypothetical protein